MSTDKSAVPSRRVASRRPLARMRAYVCARIYTTVCTGSVCEQVSARYAAVQARRQIFLSNSAT